MTYNSTFPDKPRKPLKRSGFKKKDPSEMKFLKKTPLRSKTPLNSSKTTPKTKVKRKKGKLSMAKLKKKLDAVFSKVIRHSHAVNGVVTCYTCGKVGEVKTMQCGHFVSRQYLATRWSKDNTRPQCAGCNLFGDGKPLDFEENLKEEIGDVKVEEMKKSRHQIIKLDVKWYEAEIKKYEVELKEYE